MKNKLALLFVPVLLCARLSADTQSEWYASLSNKREATSVRVGGENWRASDADKPLPYRFPCGAVLHSTAGGLRLDLNNTIIDGGIYAYGDISIFLIGASVSFGGVRSEGSMLIFGYGSLLVNRLDKPGSSDDLYYGGVTSDRSLSVCMGASVTVKEPAGAGLRGSDSVFISASTVGVHGAGGCGIFSYNRVDILGAAVAISSYVDGIEAQGSGGVVIDGSVVNIFSRDDGIEGYAGINITHSYAAIASIVNDVRCYPLRAVMSNNAEVRLENAIVKLLSRGYSTINTYKAMFGEGDYYIATDSPYSGAISVDDVYIKGGNVRVCSPGEDSKGVTALHFQIDSGRLEIVDKIDVREFLKYDAAAAAAFTGALASDIDVTSLMANFYSQVILDAISNAKIGNLNGVPNVGIDCSGSFDTYIQNGGTVWGDLSKYGVMCYKPVVNGGSYKGQFYNPSYSYTVSGGHDPVSPVNSSGNTLKCVSYAVAGAKKYDKITQSWSGILPSHYGTGSLYADAAGKLYFWVPESWNVPDGGSGGGDSGNGGSGSGGDSGGGNAGVTADLAFYVPTHYGWTESLIVSSDPSATAPQRVFEQGDPIYLNYAFNNAGDGMVVSNFVNRFTLSNGVYWENSWMGYAVPAGGWGWLGYGFKPEFLNNLPPGDYTLACSLNSNGLLPERSTGNNAISVSFTINGPNLKVSSASVSKQTITLSESAIVHWRTDNDGASAAGKTQTAFQIWKYDSSAENWILKKTEWLSCNPLASGAGRECTRTVTGKSLGVGKYIFRVWADGKDAVREKNESDNYADTYSLTVEKDNAVKSSSGVDWQFKKKSSKEADSFFLSASSSLKKKAATFKVGQTIYMRCCWWNATKKAANGYMKMTVSLNGRTGLYSEGWSHPKNSWHYLTDTSPAFLQNLPPGKYTLTATLDSENNWTEKNEKNNIKRISFTVVEAPVIYGEEAYTCALREPVSWPVSSEGTVTVKGLPPGLKYSGGAIAGKATKTGTFTVKFTSKNAAGTKTKTIKITVVNPGFNVDVTVRANGATEGMSIASGGTIPMYTGVKQNIAIVSEPGKSGIAKSAVSSVTVKGLPAGLKYSKGVISGVPAKEGTYTVKLAFKNALGWSKTFTVKMAVKTLPAFARGTFNGWTYCSIGEALGKVSQVRKATISVTKAGKITATVGSLKFTGTGWTVEADEDGLYWADLRTVRTVGSGKKAKKYTDILSIGLNPAAAWTEDQLDARIATFGGAVSLANALSALEGENALSPSNEDTYVLARRNPFGDNADAKSVAAVLAAQGTRTFTDESGLVWNVKMSSNGVATISRTTGSGKNKKTVSASAVLEVDSDAGGNLTGATRFTVSGKVIAIPW